MDASDASPFFALSAIAGPALLTNATSLLILSTTGRFARAVDRQRTLVDALKGDDRPSRDAMQRELASTRTRVRVVVRALTALYTAFGMFALATMLSIVGMVAGSFNVTWIVGTDAILAALAGFLGFTGLAIAAFCLVQESRLVLLALQFEDRIAAIEIGSNMTGEPG